MSWRAIVLAGVATAMVAAPAVGQQRRLRVPAASVRYRAAETPMTMGDRATMLTQMTGMAQNSRALAEPVRLSVNHPSHLERIFINGSNITTHVWAGRELWRLNQVGPFVTSRLEISIFRGAISAPVLVDCLVSGHHKTSASPQAKLTLVALGADGTPATQVMDVPPQPGHIMAVIWPPPAHLSHAFLRLSLTNPETEVEVNYCEVTATR